MKTRCCRSTPRCVGCPVRAAAARLKQGSGDDPAVLVSEILTHPRARALPPSVAGALAQLELVRTR